MAKPHRNLRTMVKNECGTAIVSQFDCGFDALARRSSVVNSGQAFTADAFNLYGYNDRNELGESSRYLGNNIAVTATPVPSEHRAYGYDPIGNRTQSAAGSLGWSYASNELNQYTLESVSGDGTDAFSYDEDGNLTAIDFGSSQDVTYTYDAENRLIAVAPPTPVANDKKTEFLYDYMGRRVRKQVSTYTDGAWVQETQKRYVYDGWNLIAEIQGSSPIYYVWGLDLSGTLQGAGGVGGLLGTFTGTAGYFALYDTNGNITDYLDAQGLVVAHYEYDPYGGTIGASGEKHADFALRFSTKYLDDTGLYYYGYRYYSPALGRWMTEDPIEELGGLNLYVFISNSPKNYVDEFGLEPFVFPSTTTAGDVETDIVLRLARSFLEVNGNYQLTTLFLSNYLNNGADITMTNSMIDIIEDNRTFKEGKNRRIGEIIKDNAAGQITHMDEGYPNIVAFDQGAGDLFSAFHELHFAIGMKGCITHSGASLKYSGSLLTKYYDWWGFKNVDSDEKLTGLRQPFLAALSNQVNSHPGIYRMLKKWIDMREYRFVALQERKWVQPFTITGRRFENSVSIFVYGDSVNITPPNQQSSY